MDIFWIPDPDPDPDPHNNTCGSATLETGLVSLSPQNICSRKIGIFFQRLYCLPVHVNVSVAESEPSGAATFRVEPEPIFLYRNRNNLFH